MDRIVNGEALTPVYGWTWGHYLIATDSVEAARTGAGRFVVSHSTWGDDGTQTLTYVDAWWTLADALQGARADKGTRS